MDSSRSRCRRRVARSADANCPAWIRPKPGHLNTDLSRATINWPKGKHSEQSDELHDARPPQLHCFSEA